MPTTIGGFQFRDRVPFEGSGNIRFQFANDATRIERPITYHNWATLPNFVGEILGDVTVVPSYRSGVGVILRKLPHPFIFHANNTPIDEWLWATAINPCEGKSLDATTPIPVTGQPLFNYAEMKIIYTTLPYELLQDGDEFGRMRFVPQVIGTDVQDAPLNDNGVTLPDEATLMRFITRIPNPFVRAITIPRALMQWNLEGGDKDSTPPTGKGPKIYESPGRIEPGMILTYIWHGIPRNYIPWTAIGDSMGKVNQFVFDTRFLPETLLCEAPKIVPITNHLGKRLCDIHYQFRFLPKVKQTGNTPIPSVVGHNHLLRYIPRTPVTGQPDFVIDYRKLTSDGLVGGNPIYQKYDFAKLFRAQL